MKIVEAQSATLTNFEVDTFIKEQRRTYGKRKGENLCTYHQFMHASDVKRPCSSTS